MLGFQAPLLSDTTIAQLPVVQYDAVVIGAGVAGLTFALGLPPDWRVAILTKGALGESNTRYAQGGLSAPIGADDSVSLHVVDTLSAGAGLCDEAAVLALVAGATQAVDWLVSIGADFDRDPVTGEILLGREAAHSRRRVLHAGGDATGAEIERALVTALRDQQNVTVFDHAFALDLMVEAGRCRGLVAALTADDIKLTQLASQVVVLAAGGAGQLWATTSNPLGATADGLAMAIRAGVAIADTEFVQFHPTVLTDGSNNAFLVSEAVRGEGAYLRNSAGERFMLLEHDLAELAPRDVVARGIQRAIADDPAGKVVLDLRHLDAAAMHRRFPTISKELKSRGLDLATDLIPVAPAAHYFIGGVVASTDGVTSLPGLLALGEASCTGVHGANRLASNSLLEGLVFGHEAAMTTGRTLTTSAAATRSTVALDQHQAVDWLSLDTPAIRDRRRRLQETMSQNVAVVRDEAGLRAALATMATLLTEIDGLGIDNRAGWQIRNMVIAANAVAEAALGRLESRGAHFRADFPAADPDLEGEHQYAGGLAGPEWQFGTLAEARAVAAPVV